MPVTVAGITAVLIPSLLSAGMVGTGMPKYAKGIAMGLSIWVPQITVTTVDVGSAGSGTNVPQPLLIPPQPLHLSLLSSMTAKGLAGPFMPTLMLGLANGLSQAFLQMLIRTLHAGVGVGAGVARFQAPPAVAAIRQGLADEGVSGDPTHSAAIAQALDVIFAALTIPIAIVGPPSPSPGTGTGSGHIV